MPCMIALSYETLSLRHGKEISTFVIYYALGNIALVFAAQVCRDSEIAGFPIRIYYGIAIVLLIQSHEGFTIALPIQSLDPAVYGVFW